jgi:hypothetical protein
MTMTSSSVVGFSCSYFVVYYSSGLAVVELPTSNPTYLLSPLTPPSTSTIYIFILFIRYANYPSPTHPSTLIIPSLTAVSESYFYTPMPP